MDDRLHRQRGKQNFHGNRTPSTAALRAVCGPTERIQRNALPCGNAGMKHPGTANLTNMSSSRSRVPARFVVERDGDNLLAVRSTPGIGIRTDTPSYDEMLTDLGWTRPHLRRTRSIEGRGKRRHRALTGDRFVGRIHGSDLSMNAALGNAKARVWSWNSHPVPLHREPLYSNRATSSTTRPTPTRSSAGATL